MSGIPAGAGSLLGKRLGKYEILALLALGGTAEIYLARIGGAAGFEKYVVVKCLHDHLADDQEFVKMFLDEARLAAHLDHSNIVQTMELGEHENRYYMVMEFLAGLSLAMVVRRAGERLPGGKMPVPLTLNMIAQACAGLHYAHERAVNGKLLNIVHRDISPQNLVVSFEGVVKVVDFGIAKAEQRETKTRSGTIKGKFAYMSPEQCVAANVDRRTDVFALGVIAHELLTGKRLFKRNSPYDTYQAVIDCAVDPPSKINHELDPALDDVIMKAVEKDKDKRYPSAEAFGDALLSYLHHRGKSSGPGDVARFFDANFNQEIEEHSARMRELISGRDVAVDAGWGDEEEEKKRNATVDLGSKKGGSADNPMSLDTADLVEDRPSAGSLSDVIDDLGDVGVDEDGDGPVDRTRIEANPMERLNELERQSGAALPRPPSGAPPGPAPMAPVIPPQGQQQKMPPSGPLPLPAPPTGPVVTGSGQMPAQRPTAERFPNMSNLPTQIAAENAGRPENARTAIGEGAIVDPSGMAAAPGPLPMDYPVMNAGLREQIARGADVFPGRPVGRAHASSPTMPPQSGPQVAPQSGPLPVFPDSGPMPVQHAANLMSPVGQQYPQQVDWAEAAAMPARAVPPWVMVLLFIGAIVAAMLVFILIGSIVR